MSNLIPPSYTGFVEQYQALVGRVKDIFAHARSDPCASIDGIDFGVDRVTVSFSREAIGTRLCDELYFPAELLWADDWQARYDAFRAQEDARKSLALTEAGAENTRRWNREQAFIMMRERIELEGVLKS